jgi:hypothetical protein
VPEVVGSLSLDEDITSAWQCVGSGERTSDDRSTEVVEIAVGVSFGQSSAVKLGEGSGSISLSEDKREMAMKTHVMAVNGVIGKSSESIDFQASGTRATSGGAVISQSGRFLVERGRRLRIQVSSMMAITLQPNLR